MLLKMMRTNQFKLKSKRSKKETLRLLKLARVKRVVVLTRRMLRIRVMSRHSKR